MLHICIVCSASNSRLVMREKRTPIRDGRISRLLEPLAERFRLERDLFSLPLFSVLLYGLVLLFSLIGHSVASASNGVTYCFLRSLKAGLDFLWKGGFFDYILFVYTHTFSSQY